ncbi:MAG TPA: hypothetical protein VMX17_02285 [Candidatus Glassbacteria bacterium]|nr:hypothetical protein [Candidatus Glassbacteria bacterium]
MDEEKISFEESFRDLAINLFLDENDISIYDLITYQDSILRIIMSYANGKDIYFKEMCDEMEVTAYVPAETMDYILSKVHKFSEFHTKIARIIEPKD